MLMRPMLAVIANNILCNRGLSIDKLLGRKRPSFKTTEAAGHALRSHSML